MDIRLECSRGPCEGRSITLKLGRHGIGRELDNALRVAEDEAASAHHAAVLVRTTATVLEDQGSHNGTHLNGVRLCVPTVLGEGDLIRIGVSEWRFMRLAGDAVTVDPEPQPLVLEVTATHEVDEPRLLVLDGPHRGRVLEVKAAEPVVIGRSPRADLVINDTFVSREHATFFRRGDEVAVLDNDSSNGVYVNGERIRMIHLTDGDEVRIGRTHFRFVALGSPLPGLEELPARPPAAAEATAEPAAEPAAAPAPEPPAVEGEPVEGAPLGRYGPFLLHGEVGRGGMGRIFAARRPGEEPVALKVLILKGLDQSRAVRRRRRFEREVQVLREIRHENVVAFREAGQVESRPYLAMELLQGPDLAGELRRHGRLPYQESERILFQLCAAVSAVHAAGVVHRDIKPANVILHGPRRVVKLADFGIARYLAEPDLEDDDEQLAADETTITGAGRHPGTPLYMSPEQVRAEDFDMRSDIWALGVVLYQLVSGRRPFEGRVGKEVMQAVETACPAELPADVPAYVRSAVYRCLLKPPAWRFSSAIELMDALHERRIEQLAPVGLSGTPEHPFSQCPYCQARIAAGRERCPICQADLHLFGENQMLLVELEGRGHVGCGACGHPVALNDAVCLRCGRRFIHRRGLGTDDGMLNEAESEALASGLARLRKCPCCGQAAHPKMSQCTFCGLHLRAALIGRLTVRDDEQGNAAVHCGNCDQVMVQSDLPGCPMCGLNFATGRMLDGRPWHVGDRRRR